MARCNKTGQFISRGWLPKMAEFYALLLDLSENGTEPVECGFARLGYLIGVGGRTANRFADRFRSIGCLEYHSQPGSLTTIRVTERGRA